VRTIKLRRAILVMLLAGAALAGMAVSDHDSDRIQYRWRNVEIVGGGYVPGIVFNTSEPDLVYARTDIGGAYRWNPDTSRWIPLLDWVGWDNWGYTGVDSLATDPVDPDRVYVLAGSYTNSFDPNNGAVLRSRDRGRHWKIAPLPFKVGGNMPGRNLGERLAIDPNDDSILYLGARSGNGLWRSDDFGETWNRVTTFPATGRYVQSPSDPSGYTSDPQGVIWIVFDPRTGGTASATQTIYVGVADLGTSIYRSTDGGVTWQALAGQPTAPAFMPHHAVLASTGMLYIAYNNNGGPFDGTMGDVWKYDTGAGAWTKITPDPSSSTNSWFGYGGITVDALHPDTIVVSELNRWWPDVNLWRSTNGGATWKSIWTWGAYPNRVFQYVHDITGAPWLTFAATPALPEVSPKLGWMVGNIQIDPFNSDRMLYGTGATIYGTDNLTNWDGGVPITIQVKAQGLEETAVLDLISPPEGAHLVSALGDIGGFRHDDLSVVPASMFTNPVSTTTTSLDYAALSPAKIFRVGSGQAPQAAYSIDGGTTWTPVTSRPGSAGAGIVALNADGTSVVWSPSNEAVNYSSDNGTTWTRSSGIPQGAPVASDRLNPARFYAFAGGTFYVSEDRGATFAATAAAGLPARGPVHFKAAPDREGHVWLAGGSTGGEYGLWFSADSGASFAKLPNVDQADTIGFGKAAPHGRYPALYASAKIDGVRGIYRSDDAGRHWVRINDDRHQYASTGQTITGDPRVYGRVYVGTNGRGIIFGHPADDDDHGERGDHGDARER
jgi:xyloglucan-specific exo-beta-1,4-glucanase